MLKFKTMQSDLKKYNNLNCEIIRELNEEEYDKKEIGIKMYKIKLSNNIIIDAFEDELIE